MAEDWIQHTKMEDYMSNTAEKAKKIEDLTSDIMWEVEDLVATIDALEDRVSELEDKVDELTDENLDLNKEVERLEEYTEGV